MGALSSRNRQSNQDTLRNCKICLESYNPEETYTIEKCKCYFCTGCLKQYLTFKIKARVYEIHCPDPRCKIGYFQVSELKEMAWFDQVLTDQHQAYRQTVEVVLDANRVWCPEPDCDTICHIKPKLPKNLTRWARKVTCPTCSKKFCSICAQDWHVGLKCGQVNQAGTSTPEAGTSNQQAGTSTDTENTQKTMKPCPNCHIMIERNRGCHRIICRVCQHMFCWLCLASLNVSTLSMSLNKFLSYFLIFRMIP